MPTRSTRRPAGTTAEKKITGRGRHLAVDCEGWLLALVVTAASVSDKAGAKLLAIRLFDAFTTLQIMWADSGYDGAPLARWVKTVAAITVEVVRRTSAYSFQIVRRRWVIERTFGWLMRYRRLARDYERRPENHEAMVYWATVFIMTRRLARYETGQPPAKRWGGDRKPGCGLQEAPSEHRGRVTQARRRRQGPACKGQKTTTTAPTGRWSW